MLFSGRSPGRVSDSGGELHCSYRCYRETHCAMVTPTRELRNYNVRVYGVLSINIYFFFFRQLIKKKD